MGNVKLEHPSPAVRNYNAAQLKKLIIDKFNLRIKREEPQPVWIWGAPGIGKTDIVKQAVKELGCDLTVWHLSVTEPADFMGVPGVIEVEGMKRTVFFLPEVFPTTNGINDKGCILFFDEMNRASKPVLAAALGLILDGKLNNYKIPSKCLIIAAGNRKEEVPSVEEIEPALANRFAHVNLVTTFHDWEEWAMSIGRKDVHPDIYAFLSVRKEFFHYLDPEVDSPAWPSPRSWVKASQHYMFSTEGGKHDISKKELEDVFAPYIGNGPATEFSNFVDMKKEFDPKDIDKIYKDGDKAPLPKMDRMDKAIAVLSAVAFYKRDITLTDDEVRNIFKYALRFDEVELSTAFLGLVKLVHTYLPKNKAYIDGIKDFHTKFQKDLPSSAPAGPRKKKSE